MKNKGFTLVELIGVIIILGVITLIISPAIRNVISNSKQELYDAQINNIVEGLKNWAIDNNRLLPQNEGESITITLGQLKMGGFIDSELQNPKTNKCFGNDMTLSITRYQKNYLYDVNKDTGIENDKCDDYIRPYIMLNGDPIVYVEVGDTYKELGAVAKNELGNDLTNTIIKSISGSGESIDTSKIGNKYTITYSVNSSNNTASINRTIIVRDTISPMIAIAENTTIGKLDTTFDLMDGITTTDNSGETVNVSVKSNISFGIPGEYTITYTATDSSGNTTSKKRLLTIGKVVHDNMVADSACIKNTNLSCPSGLEVSVDVNDTETYNFYVIDDTKKELTLIMDRNLGDNVAWLSVANYITANTDETSCDDDACNDEGPITALNALIERTNEWTNITEKMYTISGIGHDEKTQDYDDITIKSRARLLTYKEAKTLGCTKDSESCPSWLSTNLYGTGDSTKDSKGNFKYGYWTTTSVTDQPVNAWRVYCGMYLHASYVYRDYHSGLRPVITIKK